MQQNYLVLARKYRPLDFSALKGQEFLVTTLVNSIKLNRLAHTFLLTGIRGSGKTTTARIIARTINCSNPSFEENIVLPCYKCQNCVASVNDNHPDIIELDAASRTGVDDIRSIIENANYLPLMGKYKIFIIDEVHMLSNNAFNALLKTLEEPPAHVKFIFATTELRKIPITILSRCQKFELRRQTSAEIAQNLKEISLKEKIEISDEAINLVAMHSEGSFRDSLSLLDMLIAGSGENQISFETVKAQLGLTDYSKSLDVLLRVVEGSAAEAIEILDEIYYQGKDIILFLQHLLELIHNLSKHALSIKSESLVVEESEKLQKLLSLLSIQELTILWQIIVKSMPEIQHAFNQKLAAEMLLIKLCHLSKIPSPAELISKLDFQAPLNNNQPAPQQVTQQIANKEEFVKKKLLSYEELVNLFYLNKEILLYEYLHNDVKLIDFDPPKLKIQLNKHVPLNFTNKIAALLKEYTGEKWTITTCSEGVNAQETLADQALKIKEDKINELKKQPIIAEVYDNFPSAVIKDVS